MDVRCSGPERFGEINPVGYQTAGSGLEPVRVNGGQAVLRCQLDDTCAVSVRECFGQYDQAAAGGACQRDYRALDLWIIVNWRCAQFQPKRNGTGLSLTQKGFSIGSRVRVEQKSQPLNCRRDLLEQSWPFASQARLVGDESCYDAARLRQASDKPTADRIGHIDENNRNCVVLA